MHLFGQMWNIKDKGLSSVLALSFHCRHPFWLSYVVTTSMTKLTASCGYYFDAMRLLCKIIQLTLGSLNP